MEPGKCLNCGNKFEETNNPNTSNQLIQFNTDKKCQQYLQRDSIESNYSESIILESEKSENQIESINQNIEDSCVISTSNENNSALFQSDANTYENVKVANSRNVIIGNVTYITGPVHVTQISTDIEEENITNQIFTNDSDLEITNLKIISRENWMALPPKEVTQLPENARYVIIAHTATEAGYTEPQNALLVKLIQIYHHDSRKWDDLAYNFLVGCDGNIYEGRGWNVQGAHTYGYNKKSICIAFIGCFMDHLPPVCALNAARKLISEGIKLGFIPEDYTLVAHCQCTPIESPGVQLFNEIKKWPRWRELTPDDTKF